MDTRLDATTLSVSKKKELDMRKEKIGLSNLLIVSHHHRDRLRGKPFWTQY